MSAPSESSQHAGLAAREARRRGDVEFLISLLTTNPEKRARVAAARQLGKLGNPDGVPALIRALQVTDQAVKMAALRALAEIGDARGIDSVFDVATHPSESFDVRGTAAHALLRLNDPRGVSALAALFDVENVKYRASFMKWAARLLVEAKGVEALPKLRAARSTVRGLNRLRLDRAIRTLERIERSQASATE
jgi:HEAT repeat protein